MKERKNNVSRNEYSQNLIQKNKNGFLITELFYHFVLSTSSAGHSALERKCMGLTIFVLDIVSSKLEVLVLR